MGGVAVLRPEDSFNRQNHHRNRQSTTSSMQSKPCQSVDSRSTDSRSMNRQKRCPPKRTPAAAPPAVRNSTAIPLKERNRSITAGVRNTVKPNSDLVMGNFKILKRGEVLHDAKPSSTVADGDLNGAKAVLSSSANRFVSRNFPTYDFYAGSAFITSPEPSSLPLPGFFLKKTTSVNNVTDTDSNATYGACYAFAG